MSRAENSSHICSGKGAHIFHTLLTGHLLIPVIESKHPIDLVTERVQCNSAIPLGIRPDKSAVFD